MPKKKPSVERNTSIFNFDDMDDVSLSSMVNRRAKEAEDHYNKEMSLKSVREQNNKMYLGDYVKEKLIDKRYEDIYIDNRQFTSVRTIVPFLTARITQPEVVPANNDDISTYFARDFEKGLARHAQKRYARAKIRMAIEDLLRGERVGILKWVYDAKLDTVELKHCKPGSVIIGKRSAQFEEPDFIRHKQKRTVGDLIKQFPHKEAQILELFEVERKVASQLEKEQEINEDWIWVDVNGKSELIVCWSHQNFIFEKMVNPNWKQGGRNMIESPMVPFVFFNFLNDGSGYIDNTSYIEQAGYLQKNYNKRGQTIADNAKYAGIGVPIFAKGSISAKDVAKVQFSPIQRILLKGEDMGKAFTTWQSSPLPQFIVEDKYDDRNSIDNIWGTPNVFRGEQSKNNTLGQDVLVRDQAEGRMGDPIDSIDDSMERFFQIEAQMMYVYFDEDHYYKYAGKAGKFISVTINQKRLGENLGIEIGVVSGTSLPIDRASKKATIMELAKMNKIGTLTMYKELGIFDDPEQAFAEFVKEQTDAAGLVAEEESRIFDRDAQEDLSVVIGGKIPEERDDLPDSYLAYLNEYLLKDSFKFLTTEEKARVSQYIDAVTEKAKRKMIKLAMQVNPNPGVPQPGSPEPTAAPGMAPLEPNVGGQSLSAALAAAAPQQEQAPQTA
jgi:hypothetical protein